MVRPKKQRLVSIKPSADYFKPQGVPLSELEEVTLTMDEFEAIRLNDVQELSQNDGADKMSVSQSTFQRILASARKKIGDALTNGKAIKIEGGVYEMFERSREQEQRSNRFFRSRLGLSRNAVTTCVCPNCNHTMPHTRGISCLSIPCPKCNTRMIGKFQEILKKPDQN